MLTGEATSGSRVGDKLECTQPDGRENRKCVTFRARNDEALS